MEVIKVTPRGFCKGVVHAIETAKKARITYPNQKITILGMLVHNQSVVDALKSYDIETIDQKGKSRWDLLDEIKEGVVIFTAHGISENVMKKAIDKGLIIVDATCEFVSIIHEAVKEKLSEGYEVAYIGKKGHPESEAVISMSPHVHLIEKIEDFNFQCDKLFVTNQTTLSYETTRSFYEQIQHLYPHAVLHNEICSATRMRQEALKNLEHVDALFVVGDPKSHNTQKLLEIGKESADEVYLVENLDQCQNIDLRSFQKVAVTSGASTPTRITQQIIQYLEGNNVTKMNIKDII